MTSDRVKVLAIMGAGRCGSTLIDTVLGSTDGFFSAGELRELWSRGLVEQRRCGCGMPIPSCPVWQEVLGRSTDSSEPLAQIAPAHVVRWQSRLARSRHTTQLLRQPTTGPFDGNLAELVGLMDALYRSIAAVTSSRVVVDSSKRPSDAALLRLLPNVDPYVVHLVRDPRAVAYSWQRARVELDAPGGGEHMPTRPTLQSARVWLELNLLGQLVTHTYGPGRSMLVRYEDFVRHPRAVTSSIIRLVGERGEPAVDEDGTARLLPNHTVGGNPRRFDGGLTTIESDDEWRLGLRPHHERLCSALTAPLNMAYGYPLRHRPGPRPGVAA